MTAVTITSMTGFARAEGRLEARLEGKTTLAWSWEARSVNGKNLEVRARVPHGYESLEIPARQAVAEMFARGSINLVLTVTTDSAARDVSIDETLLDQLIALAARKALAFSREEKATIDPARLDGLMALAQTRASGETIDAQALAARDAALLAGLKGALEKLASARRQEGVQLGSVVAGHIDTIAALCAEARDLAATQPEAIKARLLQQIAELTQAVPALAPERLAQEAVLLAVKADIREELDRLSAHVEQARAILAKGEPCGRRLDFLSQEFNREANTLCSKSADVALTRVGLALKQAIDQFREQVQNIE
jgi:uncharacterized protein (TIGR00255 family)